MKHFHSFWHQREIGRKSIFGWEWKAGCRNISFDLRVSSDWVSNRTLWVCPLSAPHAIWFYIIHHRYSNSDLNCVRLYLVTARFFRFLRKKKIPNVWGYLLYPVLPNTASLLPLCSVTSPHSCVAHNLIFLFFTTQSLCSCPSWMPILFCSIN